MSSKICIKSRKKSFYAFFISLLVFDGSKSWKRNENNEGFRKLKTILATGVHIRRPHDPISASGSVRDKSSRFSSNWDIQWHPIRRIHCWSRSLSRPSEESHCVDCPSLRVLSKLSERRQRLTSTHNKRTTGTAFIAITTISLFR